MVKVKYKRLYANAQLPKRMSGKAACYDLFAHLENRDVVMIKRAEHSGGFLPHPVSLVEGYARVFVPSGATVLVPTGFATALPAGWEGQIRPRSSVNKLGITIPNAPGTIDEDYRGEWLVAIQNTNEYVIGVDHGDAIAQVKFSPVWTVEDEEVEDLDETERGAGGFGSTTILRAG